MWGLCLSTRMLSMHPTLMTMIADDRAQSLRSSAESRRGRVVRSGTRRFFILRRRPRRTARVAHV
jgi:hypothetical protein